MGVTRGGGVVLGALLLAASPALASPGTPRHGHRAAPAARAAHRRHPADARPARANPSISIRASPLQPTGTQLVVLSGVVSGAPPGSVVQLYKSAYPYRDTALVRTAVLASDGAFRFGVHPDRNTRYRAVLAGTAASASVEIDVAAKTIIHVSALPLGRALVNILIFHPSDLLWGSAPARWSFSSGGSNTALTARTRRLSRYVVLLQTTITLPAGPFRWSVCFHAPGDHALLDLRRPPGCSGRGAHGGGSLPVGYPGPGAITSAAGVLSARLGRTAFAVVDSEGRMSGLHLHWTFVTGSVVKAMLLVAYLRYLDANGQHYIDRNSNSFLYPMIHVSDNTAATDCWSIVGNSGLYGVARAAGMTEFSVTTDWGSAQLSAADQARFFFEMDSLIPNEFVTYARFLLSTIVDYESWGIPAVARPLGYTVFFKGGWRGTGLGQLVHQIARLEGHGRTFSIAVMTDGDPSMQYGIDTIQAVTAALL
jgi:hypothetical protein